MSAEFVTAAQRLVDILEQENDALKRHDFPSATLLLAAKDAAVADLAKQPSPVATDPLATLMRHVTALANENQSLLERALTVQTRIIRIVARACAPPPAATQYNTHGSRPASHRAAALAVSTHV